MRSPLALALGLVLLAPVLALRPEDASAQAAGAVREGPRVRAIEITGVDALPGLERRCGRPVDCIRASRDRDERLALVPLPRLKGGRGVARRPASELARAGASLQTFQRFEIYTADRGFEFSRAATIFDMQGGASLRLASSLSLTAGYRMLGYEIDGDSIDLQNDTGGPLFGVAFDF